MRNLLIRFLCFLLDRRGGLSFGGPGGNDIRDIINNINTGGGVPSLPLDSVQFHNPLNAFDGSANFRYQDTAATGVLIGQDFRLNLSSNGGPGDVYIKYNSANDYFELYTDGNLRIQA